MALGLFTVLKSVPWSTVISNAPVVADGARKLWKAVASRSAAGEASDTERSTPPAAPVDEQPAPPLQAEIAELREASARLEQQMLASSELITALAEQNTQLIELVEANRVRSLWLARLVIALAVVAVVALALALYRLAA